MEKEKVGRRRRQKVSSAASEPPNSEQEAQPSAFETNVRRDSTEEEACLEVEQYASAIGTFFEGARSDLCFGVLGHWGRGKTYLMNLVSSRLKKKNYHVVTFSAWKYSALPQLWIHLYERFAEEVETQGFLRKTGTSLRAGLERHGLWALIVALCGFSACLLSLGEKFQVLRYFLNVLGVSGLLLVLRFLFAMRGRGSRIGQKFLSIARHGSQLGLQETVGRDLRALVLGWMPTAIGSKQGHGRNLALVGLLGWVVLSVFWLFPEFLGANFSFVVVAWVVVVFVLLSAFALMPNPSRVLLVVDDLDRCEPSDLLRVIESLKMFLEEEAISDRVQIALLVEELALRTAILSKYEHLRGSGPSDEQIIRENIEKLFVAQIRLPELRREELGLVMEGVLSSQVGFDLRLSTSGRPGRWSRLLQWLIEGFSRGAGHLSARPFKAVLSASEKGCLISAASRMADSEELGHRLGPRSVRCLYGRYQLARLLLSELSVSYDPDSLATILAMHGRYSDEPTRRELLSVARQVSVDQGPTHAAELAEPGAKPTRQS